MGYITATSKKYVVWKRNDGVIGATAGHMPWDYTGANGDVAKFEFIFETDVWEEAYDRIVLERHNRSQS